MELLDICSSYKWIFSDHNHTETVLVQCSSNCYRIVGDFKILAKFVFA